MSLSIVFRIMDNNNFDSEEIISADNEDDMGEIEEVEEEENDQEDELEEEEEEEEEDENDNTVIAWTNDDGETFFNGERVEIEEETSTCSICLEDLVVGEEVAKVGCGHVFHTPCLATWLKQRDSCPLCRMSFREEGDM